MRTIKAFDGSAVISDFYPKNNFISIENITFELKNNGKAVQTGNTSHMLWKIDEIISHVSHNFCQATTRCVGSHRGAELASRYSMAQTFMTFSSKRDTRSEDSRR